MTTTRRGALALAAALLASTGTVEAAEEVRLRLTWWGNPDRDKRTFAAIDAYPQQGEVAAANAELSGWRSTNCP